MSRRLAAVAALAAALLAGCGSPASPTSQPAAAPSRLTGPITVFAAASLHQSFTTLARRFEQAHPGMRVTLSVGASSTLAAQIDQGAPADVFASASQRDMDTVVRHGQAAASTPFATNVAEIAVAPGNPLGIRGVTDLARPGLKVAFCQPEVPCGAVAGQVVRAAGVAVRPVTLEADVTATLTKVSLGEVDAAIVYTTDVRAAGGRVAGVPIPATLNASTSYPIAALTGSRNPAAATAFVQYVLSSDGATVLRAAGFGAP